MVLPEDLDNLDDIAQEAVDYFRRFRIFSQDLHPGLDVSTTIVATAILREDEMTRLSEGVRMAIILDEAMYAQTMRVSKKQIKDRRIFAPFADI